MLSYDEKIQLLGKWIDASKRLCVFTGAGISCPSGIPDFRSEKGLFNVRYRSFPPEVILSHSFYVNHKEEFFRFYREKMLYPNAKPNAAHRFFAALENDTRDVSVVTQNIDGLHTAAGSTRVLELHGSVHRNVCEICKKTYGLEVISNSIKNIPTCPDDGGVLKPDVVLYEEPLPSDIINRAALAVASADTVIAVGTSFSVYPAASLIDFYRGGQFVIINRTETPFDYRSSFVINEDVIRVVSDLSATLKTCNLKY